MKLTYTKIATAIAIATTFVSPLTFAKGDNNMKFTNVDIKEATYIKLMAQDNENANLEAFLKERLCPEFDTTPHILCGFRLITGQLI